MHYATSVDGLEDVDVIVVGAGFAGLMAARDLSEQGLRVVLLEGRDRIGGRTHARELAGTDVTVDVGGTWVIPDQHPAVMAELLRYGIETVTTPEPTHFCTELNGPVSDKGFLSDGEIDEVAHTYGLVAQRAGQDVKADEALRSAGLDDELHAWMSAYVRYLAGAPLSELPASRIGSGPATDVADPDHYTHTIAGTTNALVDAIANDTEATVLLDSEVAGVEAIADGFVVRDKAGNRLVARNVIVAVPVNLLADIEFVPPIAAASELGLARHAGHSVKLLMTVRNVDAWPRIFSASCSISYARVQDRLDSGSALLVGFSDNPSMVDASPQDLQAILRAFLPDVEVLAVDSHDWNNDHFARGTWMIPKSQQLEQVEALTNPDDTGGIIFAGADLWLDALGTIEGAIASGQRAANRIVAAAARQYD